MEKVFFTLLLLFTTALPSLAAPTNSTGPWGIDIATFASISSAKRSPATAGKTMVITKVMNCNNLTIPEDRGIDVKLGGKIRYSGNLVINGPFNSELFRSLEKVGSGSLSFGPGSLKNGIYPRWLGAKGDGINNDKAAVEDSAYALPANGVLNLNGTYYSPNGFTIIRSNIFVRGSGMPQVASDLNSLTGGTILQGQTLFDGDNITLENFGVDSGITYSNAHMSGAGANGLVVHDLTLSTIHKNINVRNVVGLVRIGDYTDATAAYHGVLLEGLQYGTADNVKGVGGWFGVVLKVSDFNCGTLVGMENDSTGVVLKSETYAPVNRVNINNVIISNATARGFFGMQIEASSQELTNVNVNNVTVTGGANALTVIADSTSPVRGVSVGSVVASGVNQGVNVRGPAYGTVVGNISVFQPAGAGFYTTGNVGGVHPLDVTVNNLRVIPSVTTTTSVSIGSPLTKLVFAAINVAGGDGTTLMSGSVIDVPTSATIGQYYGTLKIGGGTAALVNGWAASFGQPTGIVTKSGWTRGYGRLSAAAATSDVFMTIPAGMSPYSLDFYTTMTGFDGTKNIPVTVHTDGTGAFSIYPNRAAYTVSWYNLTDLSFPTEIPAEGGI